MATLPLPPGDNSVGSILSVIKFADGTSLTLSQVQSLVSLQDSSGNPLLSLSNRQLLYEISGLLYSDGFDIVYEYLRTPKTTNKAYIMDSPGKSMVQSREQYQVTLDAAQYRENVAEGLYTCPRCDSKKTTARFVQIRRLDEPATAFIKCANFSCGYNWREAS